MNLDKNEKFIFKNVTHLVEALILGAAIAIAGIIIGAGNYKSKEDNRTISVEGTSEREIQAEKAILRFNIEASGNELAEIQKQLDDDILFVTEFLRKEGIKESEIDNIGTEVRDLYNSFGRKELPVNRYRLKNVMKITSTDLDKIESIAKKRGELISQGIKITSERHGWRNEAGVSYKFAQGKNTEILKEMVKEAYNDAKEIAASFAKEAKIELGEVRRARHRIENRYFHFSEREQDSKTIKIQVRSDVDYFIEN